MSASGKDYTGQKYFMLTFIEPTQKRQGGSIIWIAKCDCGNNTLVCPSRVKIGKPMSCGCLNTIGKCKDWSGQKFNKLTLIKPAGRRSGSIVWETLCDCGNITTTHPHMVASGDIKSCGCLKLEGRSGRKNDPIISSAKAIWRTKYNDGINFEDFFRLSQLNCFYCNKSPSNLWNRCINTSSDYQKTFGNFIYNGLDRIDNSLDHSIENVIPCCGICNAARLCMNIEEFIKWIDLSYNHLMTLDKQITPMSIDRSVIINFKKLFNDEQIVSANKVWHNYDDGCDFNTFLYLSKQNCTYCGRRPHRTYNVYGKKYGHFTDNQRLNGDFTYNGLDRINNSKDHSVDNIVPCCTTCNKAKSDMTLQEFLDWIKSVFVGTKRIRELINDNFPLQPIFDECRSGMITN